MTDDVLDILANSWLVIMLSTVIWLLIVLPWKKIINHELTTNWKVPAVILFLLFLAMASRWGELGSRTTDSITFKYKVDHWNGAIYRDKFDSDGFSERRESGSFSSPILRLIWDMVTGGDIIWLLYAVSKSKKKDVHNNLAQ